ncbi:hypothetical protein [Methylobacterium sp. NEAU K]|uniref:hypothetical protein n=1 Tax=Methylobacterium sp. NEAU K TaxID=3064946 RepID=UPI0027338660|nr:hypothetical protein [Methylobacterium sp. NEAU K]MDP4006512.1 hypothetical protein [Methylobacterium sp. NEAU K]
MTTGLTLGALIGPIATATIINVVLFAGLWRGHQRGRHEGRLPGAYWASLVAYMGAVGLYAYLHGQQPVSSGLDLFAAAVASEAAGVVITYGIVYSFILSRGRPWSERAWPMVCALVLTAGMIGAIFTT